jgi:hypothetical protein
MGHDDQLISYLTAELGRGRLTLFTGAGFSSEAKDCAGRFIPTGPELADELWRLCYPDGPEERDSSLQDLFHVALERERDALQRLLAERLTADPASLPDWYEPWFKLPWRRCYTVNVDDLEAAAVRRFGVTRRPRVISAMDVHASHDSEPPRDWLEVVHLNGIVTDGPERVTFSEMQYGARLAHEDDCYHRLAADLERLPFVIVGTRLAESPFWQHLDGRTVEGRPRSYLVAPQMPRARHELLRGLNVEWIQASARDFTARVLARVAL